MWTRLLLMWALGWMGSSVSAEAATFVVRPDGTGDYPTIQAAVTAAATGDVVELASGTFTGPGNRDISIGGKVIAVRSESGDPALCTIDCQGLGRGFLLLPCEGRNAFTGFTITGGVAERGAGIRDESGRGADFADCVFSRNAAASVGGGLETFRPCTFTRCVFEENSCGDVGGGFFCGSGGAAPSSTFEACVFVGNSANSGGAVYFETLSPAREANFHACTFAFNAAPGGALVSDGGPTALSHCIIVFGASGAAVTCANGGSATLGCCDLFGNAGGDWVGCITDQAGLNDNLGLDPLFCDGPGGDLRLREDSPCAPDQNPACGLIGAQPVGCPQTPIEPATWGAIKAVFR